MTTVTSREFNQNSSSVKRAAADGPVFVTDRGEPTLVVMTYADFLSLSGGGGSISDLLSATPGIGEIDIDFERSPGPPEPAEFD